LLEVLDVLYDGNTLYKLELQEPSNIELQEPSNIESYISPMWGFLGIGAIIIIGGIGGVFAIWKLWEYIRIRKQMKEYEIDESYDAEEYSTEDDVDDYERQEPWDLSVENLIKCSNCNNFINQDSTICPECGTRFIEEGSQDVQIVMEEASEEIEQIPSIKNCPKCSSIISSQTTICPFCGAVILDKGKEDNKGSSSPPPSVLTEIPQPEKEHEVKLNLSKQALILLEKIAAKGDQGMTSRQIEQFSELKTNPFIELRNLMGSGLIKRFKKRSGERTYFLTSIGHQALQFFYEQREKE
jgi:RNA polymerase subunit RPABC4/transcription elongation factor Spt4